MGNSDIVWKKKKKRNNALWKISIPFLSDLVLAAQKCNLNSYMNMKKIR